MLRAALAALLLAAPAWADDLDTFPAEIYYQEPAASGEAWLYEPQGDLAAIAERLSTYTIDDWAGMPSNVEFLAAEIDQDDVLRLDFAINGKPSYLFALVRSGPTWCNALIVPGSGDHQGRQVYDGHGPHPYHGRIAHELAEVCDTTIYVRPGHDLRSYEGVGVDGAVQRISELTMDSLSEHRGGSSDLTMLIEVTALAHWLNDRPLATLALSAGASWLAIAAMRVPACSVTLAGGFSLAEFRASSFGANGGMQISGLLEWVTESGMIEALDRPGVQVSNSTNEGWSTFAWEAETGYSCGLMPAAFCDNHPEGHRFSSATLPHVRATLADCEANDG